MRCCSLLISPQTHMSFGRPHVGQISGIFLNQHINLAEYLKVIVSCSASMKEQKRGYCVSFILQRYEIVVRVNVAWWSKASLSQSLSRFFPVALNPRLDLAGIELQSYVVLRSGDRSGTLCALE
jgi:hypothetical protein